MMVLIIIEDYLMNTGLKLMVLIIIDLSSLAGPLAYQPVQLSQTGNLIMSTLAFLAFIVVSNDDNNGSRMMMIR